VRRDTGESYHEFLTKLAQASGIETPTRADLGKLDRKRQNKGSNKDWAHPYDPDARIAKMKDGRTHLAHKAEHAVDLETGAIVAVTLQEADQGDTTTMQITLPEALEQLEAVAAITDDQVRTGEELVTDKGYHSKQTVLDVQSLGLRTYISEPDRGRQHWIDQHAERAAVYANRRRIRSERVDAATRRVVGAAQCSSVRHGRDAPNSSARTWQYSQTAARARGGLQSGSVDAHVDGYWNTTRPAGPSGCRAGYLFYSVGVSAQPSDRASPPRTQSETVYYPESPTRPMQCIM